MSPARRGAASEPVVVVVDARCLQDPSFAPRGIGRHAQAVMDGFRQQGRGKLVALTDPALPLMDARLASPFDATATNAYAAQRAAETLGRLTAYVATSPMTLGAEFARACEEADRSDLRS